MQKQSSNWLGSVFAVIAVLTLAAMGVKSSGYALQPIASPEKEVQPVKPIEPAVVNEETVPVVEPDPVPFPKDDPAPLPAPGADVPAAVITVTDFRGVPVLESIGPGQMIVISAEKAVRGPGPLSLAWSIEPDLQKFSAAGGEVLICITPGKDPTIRDDTSITITQMVALDNKVSWQRKVIKCLNGTPAPKPDPNPKPKPDPSPDPEPEPEPVVTERTVDLAVVTKGMIPADAVIVMNAIGVWNSFREDGSDYRHFDTSQTLDPKGKKAIQDAEKSNIPPPVLVIYDKASGNLLDVVKLPRTLDTIEPSGRVIPVEGSLQSVVKKYKGIK